MRFDFWNQQEQHQLSKHSIYEMQYHRVIHRLNVNTKHALCINVNLGRIINNIKAGDIDPQQLDYSKLTPLLTAALQEAIVEIETLKSEVALLKSQINN